MKSFFARRLSAGLVLFGLGVATGLVAQTLSDSPQRVEQKRADLSGAPGMEVIASTGEYKPGESRLCRTGRLGTGAWQRSNHAADRSLAAEPPRR
jgi:hypothetical protein